jgi:hypothetical protein
MKSPFLTYFTFLLLFLSCKKTSCLENAGTKVISHRKTASFNKIDLFDNVNLIITQDSTEAIAVEAGANVLPNIITSVEKGVLTIKNSTSCNWLREPSETINVYVSVSNLNNLNYQGSGRVTSTNTIVTDTITIFSKEGAGIVNLSLNTVQTNAIIQKESPDFILHGNSDNCYAAIDSRGSINFADFEVKRMYIGYICVRNATINVTESLIAVLYHTGNIYYKGNPLIENSYYSSGRLIKVP